MYRVDPDDNTKQVPSGLPATAFGSAEMPAITMVRKRPNHVLINQTGSYYFLNNTTASIDDLDIAASYTKTAIIPSTSYLPLKLEFNPVAWSGSAVEDGTTGTTLKTGNVTFVYKGGL